MLNKGLIYFAQPINKFLGVGHSLIENWEAAFLYAKKIWWELTSNGFVVISPAIMTIPVAISKFTEKGDDRELWIDFDFKVLGALQDVVIVFDDNALDYSMNRKIYTDKIHVFMWKSAGCQKEYEFAQEHGICCTLLSELRKKGNLDDCVMFGGD